MAEFLKTHEEIRRWLDEEWGKALQDHDPEPDDEIDALANANVNSIRYALVTQILGKIVSKKKDYPWVSL